LGTGDLLKDSLSHSFGIALVTIHDDVLLSPVEGVSQLLAKRLNGRLHESLLGINIKEAVSVVGYFTYGNYSFSKLLKDAQVIF